jgi:hypothetical protein
MKVRDLLLYGVIGILIAAAAILGGIYNARARLSHETITKWIGFGIMTALVFGNGIKFSRHLWNRRMFWIVLGGFVVLHLIVGVLAVSKAEKVGLLAFAVATPIEYFALVNLVEWFLTRKP